MSEHSISSRKSFKRLSTSPTLAKVQQQQTSHKNYNRFVRECNCANLERPFGHHVLRGVEWGPGGTGWGAITVKVLATRCFFDKSENERNE